jgi:hypothetical protein
MGTAGGVTREPAPVDELFVGSAPAPRPAAGNPATVPVQRRPPATDGVDARLEKLEGRLLAEVGDDPAAVLAVRSHLAAARARFAHATVREYLPILVEREVRRRLREEVRPG